MFNEMTLDEQIRQLDELAQAALASFDIAGAEFKLLTYENNAVYHIIDRNARFVKEAHYVLRIHRPGLKKLAWIQAELAWLTSIRHHTLLNVPEPAAPVYTGKLAGINIPVHCTLLGWVRGKAASEPHELTMQQVQDAGVFMAHLHQHAMNFEQPEDFERPKLDREGLFGQQSPYASPAEGRFFTDEHRQVIQTVGDKVQMTMDTIGQDDYGLIHGDLILKNILFTDDGEVGAIDFDDCAFGYYLYDLTPLLWRCRSEQNYAAIRKALWEGYTSVLALPEDYAGDVLEAFLAARHVASCRWIAGNAEHPHIRGKAQDIITGRIGELKQYLETGKLVSD